MTLKPITDAETEFLSRAAVAHADVVRTLEDAVEFGCDDLDPLLDSVEFVAGVAIAAAATVRAYRRGEIESSACTEDLFDRVTAARSAVRDAHEHLRGWMAAHPA